MGKGQPAKTHSRTPEIRNKRAGHEFEILETVEAGIALLGTEVKSLRAGLASLAEAYARIDGGQAWLINFQIEPYKQAHHGNHDPKRRKQLLLHRREIKKLAGKVTLRGQTLVPLSVYFNEKGLAKVKLALAVGRKLYDKRQEARRKEDRREMAEVRRKK